MAEAIVTRGVRREPIRFSKPSILGVGTMVWLGSELMFFSGLFAAYFTIRAHDGSPWPPAGIKLDTLQSGIFSTVLVLSSLAMQKAVFEAEHDRPRSAMRWIAVTLAMGGAFIANQAFEWATLKFGPQTNAYGSLFYVMSGVHGLHVIVGLAAMLLMLVRLKGIRGGSRHLPGLQALSYYWHFVDIVWVALFACLFLVH